MRECFHKTSMKTTNLIYMKVKSYTEFTLLLQKKNTCIDLIRMTLDRKAHHSKLIFIFIYSFSIGFDCKLKEDGIYIDSCLQTNCFDKISNFQDQLGRRMILGVDWEILSKSSFSLYRICNRLTVGRPWYWRW